MRRCGVHETRSRRAVVAEILVFCVAIAVVLLFPRAVGLHAASRAQAENPPSQTFLGFDANDYPGYDALPALRRTFTFSGYWLNAPPGAKTNSWTGRRAALLKNGFGFLVLFNGRLSRELKSPVNPNRSEEH